MSARPVLPQNHPRPRAVPARGLHGALVLVVALLLAALTSTPASAYWLASGSGAAAAGTGTLAPPADVTVPAGAVTDVPVSWTAGTGGVTPQGYHVTRVGATTTDACGSSSAQLLTRTGCVDTDVPDGDHTYVVTAVFATWTASTTSSPVTVVNPAQLSFLTPPADAAAGEMIDPPVVVTLLSAAGDPVARGGTEVTLLLGSNPGSGALSGTTTLNTQADGTASFDTLAINRAGVGYTLVATSPDLTSTTSAPFTVLPPPLLGEARSYSVLGGAGVVNTLETTVSGDLGTGRLTVASGFPPGLVGGDAHIGDADAAAALADAAATSTALQQRTATTELSGTLGGQTLKPGVYHSTAALAVTGILTLDGGPDDVFVFQVDAALDAAAGDRVLLINGARASNVYWVVNGAVTLGAGASFQGTILATGAITLGLGTELIGRALATGAVTMADVTIRFTTPQLPPAITITGGASALTTDTTPAVGGTTDAPVGTSVKVTAGGQTVMGSVQPGGSWTVTLADLLAGTYPVLAQVRDAAGNATTVSQSLTVQVNPDPPVPLGSAASFSVLSGALGTAVTNTGATVVSGDVGSSPGTVAGFPDGSSAGAIHSADTTAASARADLVSALDDAAGRVPHTEFAGDLGGRTFGVGVHHASAAVGLTGTVTLDGQGHTNPVFIFQIGAALTAAADCQVNLVNGAEAANVFWVVKGAAGTGANCFFRGTIAAEGAITLGAATSLEGRALSLAAVTLASNTLTGVTPAGAAAEAPAAARKVEPTDGSTATPDVEPSPEPSPSASDAESRSNSSTPTAAPSPTPDEPSPTLDEPSPTPDEPDPSVSPSEDPSPPAPSPVASSSPDDPSPTPVETP